MNDTIKIRGGSGTTPELQDRELGYNKTENALYIGTGEENVRLCGANDVAESKKYTDDAIGDEAIRADSYADGLSNDLYEYIEQVLTGVMNRLEALENRLEALENQT